MRNKRRHGEQSMTLQQAALWARDTAFDLWQLVHRPEPREPVSVALGWKPPASGWVKVNTDAAFHAGRKEGATASIIRDHHGGFHAAQAQWYDHCLDVCTMEAMACRDGLMLAVQLGLQRIALETDSLELVQLWKKEESQRSIVDPVLQEIDQRRLAFHEFSFSHVSRNCNKIAHLLAKQVTSTNRSERWHVTPAFASDLILYEASAG